MPTVAKAPAKKMSAKKAPVVAKKAAKKAPEKSSTAKVLYTEVKAKLCIDADAINAETAKKIIGWKELADDSTEEFLVRDENGKKIQCTNNLRNRSLYNSSVIVLAQEILRGRWKFNGEALIIGRTGIVLNGQHSLLAVILATQLYEADPDNPQYRYWKERGTLPCIDKLVVFGVDESDDVVNTMDTCKPRSLTDVIFRSEYFANVPTATRKNVARILDYAVRLMWLRTGVSADAYAPKRTHSEALDFINRHPKLIDCVKHIHDEDEEKAIGKVIPPGTAAGLMYLMASGATEPAAYHTGDPPDESLLDFELWEKAEEFWVLIASNSPAVAEIKKALTVMIEDDGGSAGERIAIINKGWQSFVENGKVRAQDIKLEYTTDEDGMKVLSECPTTGGIDVGVPSAKEDVVITPDEIKAQAEMIREEKLENSSDPKKAAKKAAKKFRSAIEPTKKDVDSKAAPTIKPQTLKEGETLWATDPENGERWKGTYIDHYNHPQRGTYVKVKVAPGYAMAGKQMDVSLKHLSRS